MDLSLLKKKICDFYSSKSIYDTYKKEVDSLNKEIKQGLNEADLTELDMPEEGLICTLTVQNRRSFKEKELIEYLKGLEQLPSGIIKTVEKIDEDALENAVYNGKIDAAKLDKFISCKKTQVLKVKSKK